MDSDTCSKEMEYGRCRENHRRGTRTVSTTRSTRKTASVDGRERGRNGQKMTVIREKTRRLLTYLISNPIVFCLCFVLGYFYTNKQTLHLIWFSVLLLR